jgi:gamma-glutamylcyclotransferase (GGCT)/AIG2-like uncharacterized protein YtfP
MTTDEPAPPTLLFVYGTLGPAFDKRSFDWREDAVRGRLYDLGPHPALVECKASTPTWVEGAVRPTDLVELESRLDPYEGVAEG